MGRKNFLFASNRLGSEHAAALYALIGTAKPNGLDAETYLHHVLDGIAEHPSNGSNDLLRWHATSVLSVWRR